MVFEKVHKNRMIKTLEPMTVSVGKTGLIISRDIVENYLNQAYVEIYLDMVGRRVGLKATADQSEGFSMQNKMSTGKGSAYIAQAISKRLPIGKYKARFEDGLIVFDVPEITK